MKSYNNRPLIRISSSSSSSRSQQSMVSDPHYLHHRLLVFIIILIIVLTTATLCIVSSKQIDATAAATTTATTTMHRRRRQRQRNLETFNGMHEEGDTTTTTTGDIVTTSDSTTTTTTGGTGSSNNNNKVNGGGIGGTTYNGMQESNRNNNNDNPNPNPNPNPNSNNGHHNMHNKMIMQNQNNIGDGGGITTIEGTTTKVDKTTRIVGGTQALPGDYPYFVDLRQIGCGGSLIAPRVVLTAAHCDESAASLIGSSVIVGAYEDNIGNNAGGTDGGFNSVTVQVSDQSIHPQYNTLTVQNDFQLLLLATPINIPDPKLTIIIQKNDEDEDEEDDEITALTTTTTTTSTTTQQQFPPEGTELSVIGLGLLEPIDDPDDPNIDFDEILPDFVMHVEVPVVNSETCFELYERVGITDFDSQTMFCAGDIIKGGIDSCQGDSGGPIVDVTSSDSSGKQHVQVGVVSWGLSCADSRFPGVYAKIQSAKEWIHDVVCDQWQVSADFCTTEQTTTAMPTPAPTIQSCGNNEIFVDWRFHIDAFGGETSFEITKSNGNVVESGFPRYDEDTSYRFQYCLPADECYKLQLTDTFGDGFCCGGNPSYKLIVDDNVLVDVMVGSPEIDFGSSIEFEFGNLCSTTPDDDTSQPTAAIVPPPPPPPPPTTAPQQFQPTLVPTIPSMLRPTAMTPNVPTSTTLPTTGSVPTITPPSSTTDEEPSSVSNPTSTTTLEPSETNASMVEDSEVEGGGGDDSNASSVTTESSASRLGLLIGISAGVLVIIILVLVLAYLLFTKRRPSSSSSVTKGKNKNNTNQIDVARDKTADAQWSDAGSYNSFNSPNGDNNGHEYTRLSLSL